MVTMSTAINNSNTTINHAKPQILCLHGLGSSGRILEAQSYRLRKALGDSFDFVFVNGPYDSCPGPGVLPTFINDGPFFQWTRSYEETYDERTFDTNSMVDIGGVRSVLSKLPPETLQRPWAGVMGFSQGGRVAAGLLKEQSLETYKPDGLLPIGMRFQFGLILNGGYPPLESKSRISQGIAKEQLIDIPSVHICGLDDPAVHVQRALAECFTSQNRVCLELKISHCLPAKSEDLESLVQAVSRCI